MSGKGFIVPLLAAVWVAAIWFAVEGYERRQSEVVLEDIRGAAAGLYGLRRMNEAYSGPLARIERGDDKSALDIGSVGDIRQFCALTTCIVRTMYDQSGNGAHMHKVD